MPRGYKRKQPFSMYRRSKKFKARGRMRPTQRGYLRRGGFYGYGRRSGAGGEHKFFDSSHTVSQLTTAGTIVAGLNTIPQGVTESERVGRKCTIRSIYWKARTNTVSTSVSANAGTVGRFIFFVDKQANGATATVGDILENANVNSFRNLANVGRFTILIDRRYALSAVAAMSTTALEHHKTITFGKKVNVPVEFDGTTGLIGTIRSNNLGILLIASDSSILDFNGTVRVRFTDN